MTLRAIDVIGYLSSIIPYPYFANEFPGEASDEAAYVQMTGGFPPDAWTSYKRPSFQIVVRGSTRGMHAAEEKAHELFNHLHGRTEFPLRIDGPTIRQCTADQSAPLFIGRDEHKRPMYSLNFTVVMLE